MTPLVVYRVETMLGARAITDNVKGNWVVVGPDSEQRITELSEVAAEGKPLTVIVCMELNPGIYYTGFKELATGLEN